MVIKEVITHPAEVLRKRSRKVADFGPELQKLIEDMIDTMRDEPGVGLAAPQIDVSSQVIVVEYGDENDDEKPPKLYVVINPTIVKVSEESVVGMEGCLSVPGFVGEVERAERVVVKGQNRNGKPIRIKAKGWLARIFQHEIDHLNGILFIDRTERVWHVEEETPQVMVAT